MPPADYKRKWIKLWIDECLTGTIREDLEPDERSVWYDFLLYAGRNRPPGNISANEDTAIPNKRLAAILNVDESLIDRSIKKFKDSKRITIDKKNIIHIANWPRYQYTDYDRVKVYRQQADHPGENQALNEYLAEIRPNYPHLDLDDELVRFNEHWSQPGKQLRRPKQALKGWLDRSWKSKGTSSPAAEKKGKHSAEDDWHTPTLD